MVGAEKTAEIRIDRQSNEHESIVREFETQVNHPVRAGRDSFIPTQSKQDKIPSHFWHKVLLYNWLTLSLSGKCRGDV